MIDLARVLLVSSDEFLSDAVAHVLRSDELAVERAASWRSAEKLLPQVQPRLVVIDAEGEGVGEKPVVDRVRMVTDVPLVVLSASPHLEDRLAGLRAGADEVLAKPFPLSELICRVNVLLRRNGHRRGTVALGDLLVDEGGHTVERRGQVVELTAIEFALLLAFCRNCGLVLSKNQLLTIVWGFDHYNLNLVEVHVSALRRKLEAAGPRIIHTVRGAGYALRPVRTESDDDPVDRHESRGDRVRRSRRSHSHVVVA
jgi:two-component system, OmpR family, response regulator